MTQCRQHPVKDLYLSSKLISILKIKESIEGQRTWHTEFALKQNANKRLPSIKYITAVPHKISQTPLNPSSNVPGLKLVTFTSLSSPTAL